VNANCLGCTGDCSACEMVIIERDTALRVIDDVKAALGIQSEWSNVYGFAQFIEEVQDKAALEGKRFKAFREGVAVALARITTGQKMQVDAMRDLFELSRKAGVQDGG
jgi:hypothetical protein